MLASYSRVSATVLVHNDIDRLPVVAVRVLLLLLLLLLLAAVVFVVVVAPVVPLIPVVGCGTCHCH